MLGKRDSTLVEESTVVCLGTSMITLQIMNTVDLRREILAERPDLYLSTVSSRSNQIMTIAAIFMPPTFLAEVRDKDLKHMPEVESRCGYVVFWLVKLAARLIMQGAFKRKEWF